MLSYGIHFLATMHTNRMSGIILALLSFGVIHNLTNGSILSMTLGLGTEAQIPYTYKLNPFYSASHVERYAMEHAVELGLHQARPMPFSCTMWKDRSRTIIEYLDGYLREQKLYTALRKAHRKTPMDDLRPYLAHNHSICESLELHPLGMGAIFPSGSLSRTHKGLVEPISPPLRDPLFCFDKKKKYSRDYLVHDFATYCRQLISTSKIIFLDIGPSGDTPSISSSTYITQLYYEFGFHFDEVYIYDSTTKGKIRINERASENDQAVYHVMDSPVDIDPDSKDNPFHDLTDKFLEEDMIIVNLNQDANNPDQVFDLAKQVITTPKLARWIDAMYIDHGVPVVELFGRRRDAPKYTSSTTLQELIQLFSALRHQGVPAHAW